MAAQNFMETPMVKAATSLASTLIGALILYVCSNLTSSISTLTTKTETVQATLSSLGTSVALTQRDLKQVDENQRATAADVKELNQAVISLQMRVGQMEKGGR